MNFPSSLRFHLFVDMRYGLIAGAFEVEKVPIDQDIFPSETRNYREQISDTI
jgi:hypothetical protein